MERPNILVFMTDHQRGDTVLSEHPAVTPNLDRFAQEGVTFTNAFCPSPDCCPSRATFHTGLYPSRHGVWNNVCNRQALAPGLNDGVRLWSEDQAESGYRLSFSGKWDVSVEHRPSEGGWTEEFVSAVAGCRSGSWDQYRKLAAAPGPAQRGEGRSYAQDMGHVASTAPVQKTAISMTRSPCRECLRRWPCCLVPRTHGVSSRVPSCPTTPTSYRRDIWASTILSMFAYLPAGRMR